MQNTYKCNQILAVLRVVPLVVRDQEVHAGRARGQTWAVRGPRREPEVVGAADDTLSNSIYRPLIRVIEPKIAI